MKKLVPMIFFLLWNICIFSCSPQNKIHWSQKVVTVENDSISTTVTQKENTIDTVRYKRSTHYEQKSPRTLSGKWYIITAIAIVSIIFFLFKN